MFGRDPLHGCTRAEVIYKVQFPTILETIWQEKKDENVLIITDEVIASLWDVVT